MPAPFVLSSDLVSAYPAKSVTLADYIDTSLASKTDLAMTQNAQTGTTYSFALADASKLLTTSNASPVSVTVTKQATVTWVTGTQLRIMNLGAGVTTLVADTGVTINGNVALKQYQGGQLIRTASDVWLFVPTASGSGMDLITPTSVAGGSLSGGSVTFSASSEVSVNGCFTSDYQNYRVMINVTTISAEAQINLRYRVSGTNSSVNYYYGGSATNWDTAVVGGFAGNNAASTFAAYGANGLNTMGVLDIMSPQLAVRTTYAFASLNSATPGNHRNGAGVHTVATAYDGFSLLPASGNITGTLRIYGMRNS